MRKMIGLMALLAAVGAIAVSASGAAAEEAVPALEAAPALEASPLSEESCASGYVCAYSGFVFGGERESFLCTGGTHHVGSIVLGRSSKNRCANKASWLREEGIAHACLNPGTNFENREFTEIWVGAEGSRC